MTLVDARQETVDRNPGLAEGYAGRGRLRWLVRRPELPWAAVAAFAVWLLVLAGNPVTDPVVYGIYWTVAIAVPGVLLQRALVGSRTLPEDLGFGTVLGIAWQLIGWFIFTALQLQALLWTWPLAVIVLFAVMRTFRKHWRVAERVPLAWSWAASASMAVAFGVLYVSWLRDTELPPRTRLFEADLWYHLAINGELTRTVLPDLPYVFGESLEYHWFVNAHMASGQLMTGVEPASIVLHLWLVPMVATLFLLTCGLSRWLTGFWWPGLVAATFTASLPLAIAISGENVGVALTPIIHASPSSVLAGVVMVALSRSVLQLLRKQSTLGDWASLALLTVVAAGTKPTILPLAIAGTIVSTVVLLIRRRRISRTLVVLSVLAVGLVTGAVAVMGGTAGSEVRLFGYFRSLKGFRAATDDDSVIGVSGSWAVPGVLESGLAGWVLAFALLAVLLLFHLPSLLGVLGVLLPSTRDDVAVWWLASAIIASYGPLLVIDHMGSSQKYFVVTAFPLAMVLTLHLLAKSLPRGRGFMFRWGVFAALIGGGVVASLSAGLFADNKWDTIPSAIISLLVPVAVFVAMATLVLTLGHRMNGRTGQSGHAVVLLGALLLGWSIPYVLAMTLGQASGDGTPRRSDGAHVTLGPRLSPPKQQAARWLAAHSNPDDVVVTNAHCFAITRRGCDARGFWISALSGRRVYLEGWGYTPENASTRTRPKIDYRFQPTPWPRRLEQSDAAVTAPTTELLERLSQHHGARWVFADKTVSQPASALYDLAILRYENRDVALFELRLAR